VVAPTGRELAGQLAAELVAAYTAQLGAYREWLSLARQAQQHLVSDDLDEFLRLHAHKEAVTGRLHDMEQRVQACRQGLAAVVGASEPTLGHLQQAAGDMDDPAFTEAVAGLSPILDELREVMQQLQAVEGTTEEMLRERLRRIRGDITQTQATRRAARAYHRPEGPSDGEARFIDHKG